MALRFALTEANVVFLLFHRELSIATAMEILMEIDANSYINYIKSIK
jgi:hypothetical protein